MQAIQMVDTKTQYQKIKNEVDNAVLDVMNSSVFIGGAAVKEFSQNLGKYLQAKHVIPCANGTDALQIALMSLNLQPGDEVITPSFTFIATTEVIALLKLTPVFVDVDKNTFCIDPAEIEKAITPKTKAIVPVHLYGQCANMEAIMQIAAKHNLFVVEDNAQAIGANFTFNDGSIKKSGTIGHIGCTSFYPSKNLGAFGDGGAIFTNDDALAETLQMIANHGMKTRYYHDLVGCNSRLDAMQAAILNIKLKYLDEYAAARQNAAAYYDKAFAASDKITVPAKVSYSSHVYHQYTILLHDVDREALIQHLSNKKIPAMIYYPLPAHKQKMFSQFHVETLELPVTSWLTERVLSLPIHTELDEEQLEYICNNVLEFVNQ